VTRGDVDEYSVSLGAEAANGEELDTWVLGDPSALARVPAVVDVFVVYASISGLATCSSVMIFGLWPMKSTGSQIDGTNADGEAAKIRDPQRHCDREGEQRQARAAIAA